MCRASVGYERMVNKAAREPCLIRPVLTCERLYFDLILCQLISLRGSLDVGVFYRKFVYNYERHLESWVFTYLCYWLFSILALIYLCDISEIRINIHMRVSYNCIVTDHLLVFPVLVCIYILRLHDLNIMLFNYYYFPLIPEVVCLLQHEGNNC